jgi:hypothetical protein
MTFWFAEDDWLFGWRLVAHYTPFALDSTNIEVTCYYVRGAVLKVSLVFDRCSMELTSEEISPLNQ